MLIKSKQFSFRFIAPSLALQVNTTANVGFCMEVEPNVPWDTCINQVRVVAVSSPQLTQASFLQKNQTLQNRFLISVTLRWHRVSVACKNQSFGNS